MHWDDYTLVVSDLHNILALFVFLVPERSDRPCELPELTSSHWSSGFAESLREPVQALSVR